MKLTGKKILVTGADGFIGSHLVEALVDMGCRVRPFVYYNAFGSWGWLDQVSPGVKSQLDVFAGDIRDPHGVAQSMQGCDVVFHLAALIGIPYSYHSPDTYVDTNVKGTLNILQSARQQGVERVLHTSTSEVYGTARYVPMDEEHPLSGQSPYAATKIGADQMALAFQRSFDVPVSIVRPFNTFGPRQSARAVIPTVITQIANGARSLALGSLHPTRDFNYISDTVRGFISIAESEKVLGEVVNVGCGFDISIGETARTIASLMGAEVEIHEDSQRVRPRDSEVDRLFADNSKIKNLTEWRPEYTGRQGFERGLERTIEWFTEPNNLKMYAWERYHV